MAEPLIQSQSFKKRRLKVKISLNHNVFKTDDRGNKYDELEFEGLRVDADINVVVNGNSNANITIWGLHPDTMNAMTTIKGLTKSSGTVGDKVNHLWLYAVDDTGRDALICEGNIFDAVADYNSQPVVPIKLFVDDYVNRVTSFENKKGGGKIGSISFDGSNSVKGIIQEIISRVNESRSRDYQYALNFICEDDTDTDTNLNGSFYEMMNTITTAKKLQWWINGSVVCVSKEGVVNKGAEFIMNRENGMIGYPVLTKNGCNVKCLFNPYLTIGDRVTVESQTVRFLTQNSDNTIEYENYNSERATMRIVMLTHKVQSEMPSGAWHTELQLSFLENLARG